jgi:tetratricopeptide (TPR) repeat protein
MARAHPWEFRKYFRANAFGWRGSRLACERLRTAVSELRSVARHDPVVAGEGIVLLFERIWPAFQRIDTSSGALGTATWHAIEELLPLLMEAPADLPARRRWMERLFEAVQEDGVDYLYQVQEAWGRLCVYPELIDHWADQLLPMIRRAWSGRAHVVICPSSICLSCLLEAGRYEELADLLALHQPFWPDHRFWAEALKRQGRVEEAIQYAESLPTNDGYEHAMLAFCEAALLEAGREEEAYRRYGLYVRAETTYLNQFRALKKRYPGRDPRQMLLDLMAASGSAGDWFAAARQSGYLDIALHCARSSVVNPKTLIAAARHTAREHPDFAAAVACRALELILQGYGYEFTGSDVREAVRYLVHAARATDQLEPMVHRLQAQAERSPSPFRTEIVGLLRRAGALALE